MTEEVRGYALGAHIHLNKPFSIAIKFRFRGGKIRLVHLMPDMINDFVGGTFKALNAANRMDAAISDLHGANSDPVSLTSAEVSAIDETTAVIRVSVAYVQKNIRATLLLQNRDELSLGMNESLAVLLAGTLSEEGSKFFSGGSMSPPTGSKLQ